MVVQVPLAPPPFTIKELRDAIPAHLFQRSTLKSSIYLGADLAIISVLFYVAYLIDQFAPTQFQWVLWPAYWVIQGAVMTGVWVIAHECGHQSYSDYKIVNNAVGWVFHSALLVPYHSWRITHGMHHKSTAHMNRDQVFVPATRSDVTPKSKTGEFLELTEDTPIASFIGIFLMSTVGWLGYIILNVTSQKHSRRANHFEPSSPIFKPDHLWDVIISDVGIAIMLGILGYASVTFGFLQVVKYYGIPYMFVNFWLVTITYLQHTHINVPHYRGDDWTFIRGALATIDRDYGILNHVFHHITDSHVCHHLFSTMPHYNAIEATEHLKKVLGSYYLEDKTPVLQALWESWTSCHFVEDDGGVVYYKTKGKETKTK